MAHAEEAPLQHESKDHRKCPDPPHQGQRAGARLEHDSTPNNTESAPARTRSRWWAITFRSGAGAAHEVARIEYFSKRLDLIEKLRKLRSDAMDAELRSLVDLEPHDIDTRLEKAPDFLRTRAAVEEVRRPKSSLDHFFLMLPSSSMRQRVLKGQFYFYLAFFAIGTLTAATVAIEHGRSWKWYHGGAGLLFWLTFALPFLGLVESKPNT